MIKTCIHAIRPDYIFQTDEYDDIASDDGGEAMKCEPCFQETEEAIKAKTKKLLEQPTAEEILEHEVSHVPFRSWCKFCVMGKGIATVSYTHLTLPTTNSV